MHTHNTAAGPTPLAVDNCSCVTAKKDEAPREKWSSLVDKANNRSRSRMTNSSRLAGTFLGVAPKVPHPSWATGLAGQHPELKHRSV